LGQQIRTHLFNPNESDLIKSISVGVGVFIGIIPIWGFQTAAAIGLSVYFKLNKILTFLGSNVSVVPFMPFILFISHRLGAFWLGEKAQTLIFNSSLSYEQVQGTLFQYIIGAVTFAILAGLFSGGVIYGCLKLLRKLKDR
jgi:uncharacterized protein (DUF2062 family)